MATLLFLLYLIFTLICLYRSVNPISWEVGSIGYLIVATFLIPHSLVPMVAIWIVVVSVLVILQVEAVRGILASIIYKKAAQSIPKLSKTEEEALHAGDTWLEKDIFIGKPDWARLGAVATKLTEEEQSFLDKETQTLCGMLDEWSIAQECDLPANVWSYIKENGFLGMVIPKEYGGKGFSARMHSDVVMKIASRSSVAAVTVMVPNSLGPGELINYYGTDEQKQYYLPRLAKGVDIPCFALTEPLAGSDATSIQSKAVVVKKKIDGEMVLGLSVTFDKRWITLAPVATLIGLAVDVKDPDGLLQGSGEEGITCILMPRETEHLEIGNRHLPANQPFMNGTLRGKDLFIPISSIIGGQKNAGKGWQMLVECLSIGRSISLPALGTASSSIAYLTSGAFSRARKQFNTEIAQFEGIAEKLAEIAGLNYIVSSTRLLTLAAVNEHKKPSVASAIAKYFNTEFARIAVNNAMDIHAGRAVVEGPRNYISNYYQGLPISITVEGANIMSRNLLIFGQGSMACHPYIREEFYAISRENKAAFNTILWQHIGYFMNNLSKAVCSAWTGGFFISVPQSPMKREYKKLARLSHAFAWLADLSLIYLGGSLKRRERLSARLADGMSYLYMAMAVLRNVSLHDNHADEVLHAKWAANYCFYHAQQSLLALCSNFPSKIIGWVMRFIAFPFGQTFCRPSDKLEQKLASLMVTNNQYRERIKQHVYLSGDPKQPVDRVEHALQLILKSQTLLQAMSDLKGLKGAALIQKLEEKVNNKEIEAEVLAQVLATEEARWDAILVDEFTFDSMKKRTFASVIDGIKSPLR